MMNKTILLLFCITSSLFVSAAKADQYDSRLDDLFLRLQNPGENDVVEVRQIEAQIWQAWLAHDNPEFSALMQRGIQKMNRNAVAAALGDFNRLVEIAPEYAEAWNKRATIHYFLKNYQASKADIAKTLMLEPYHFGALSGLGLVHMAQGEYLLARRALNSALEVNPNMQDVKNNLRALESFFRDNSI